ncbi:MAG: ATP-binding cassette domain-containing protein [Candidatus Dormibacteria bacterium]
MTARLSVTGLWSRRGSQTVIRGLTMSVDAGEFVLITGANGSGKSTLLESVAGVLRPSAGEVRLDGLRIDGRGADHVARCGLSLIHQQRRLFSSMTVRENVELAAFAMGRRAHPEPVAGLLERFGIARFANTAAGLLSGGEQRLVALARGLYSRPRLVLLDEPLAALADDLRDRLLVELTGIAAGGASIVVVEHDSDRVRPFADRVLALRMGDLVSVARPGAPS